MVFWFYFTSKCAKKPAEGPRGFKKTCQKEILEGGSILAAICKNNCVWKALIPQLVKVSTDSHICLSVQHQGFQVHFKRVIEIAAGRWFYRYNLMVLMYIKDTTGTFRVPHHFRLCCPQNLTIIHISLLTAVKYERFEELKIFRSSQEWQNWMPHKRIKPPSSILGEITFEPRYTYAALQKPGKTEQLCKRGFIASAESNLSKQELCRGVLIDSSKKCGFFFFFSILINNCKRKTMRTLSRKNMTTSLCSMKHQILKQAADYQRQHTSAINLPNLFNFQRITPKHEKITFKVGV